MFVFFVSPFTKAIYFPKRPPMSRTVSVPMRQMASCDRGLEGDATSGDEVFGDGPSGVMRHLDSSGMENGRKTTGALFVMGLVKVLASVMFSFNWMA